MPPASGPRGPSLRRVEHAVPLVHQDPPCYAGLAWAVFGAAGGSAPAALALTGLVRNPTSLPLWLLLAPGALAGAVCALLGLSRFLRRERFVITDHGVSRRRGGLLGGSSWEEPLRAYSGVACEERHEEGILGAGSYSHTDYRIVLKHSADPDRDILLYNGGSRDEAAAELVGLARLLKVPQLGACGIGSSAGAGRTDFLTAGAQAAFDPGTPIPGRRLRRELGPDGESLVCPLSGPAALVWAVLLAAAGAAASLANRFVGALGLAVAAVFALFGLADEAILLRPEAVSQEYRLWGWKLAGRSLPLREVIQVELARDQKVDHEVVRLTAQAGRIDIGHALSREERVWLRDYLRAKTRP